jgi:hypothetical protein
MALILPKTSALPAKAGIQNPFRRGERALLRNVEFQFLNKNGCTKRLGFWRIFPPASSPNRRESRLCLPPTAV